MFLQVLATWIGKTSQQLISSKGGCLVASFEKAIKVVLEHEGAFVDDENDVGGATKYGISLTYLERENYAYEILDDIDFNKNNYIDSEDIRHMPIEVAKHIYRMCWWEKYRYGDINNDDLATRVFDISVNIGPLRCHKILQESINKNLRQDFDIVVDGLMGPLTIATANGLCPATLSATFKERVAEFYRSICRKKPQRMKYLKGWLNRVYS